MRVNWALIGIKIDHPLSQKYGAGNYQLFQDA